MEVTDQGGVLEDSKEELQDDMVFRLNPLKVSKESKGDPMWSLESQTSMDWFFSEE